MDSPGGLASPRIVRLRPAAGGPQPSAASATLGPWRLLRLIHAGQRLALFRARPLNDGVGAGCYVTKSLRPDCEDALARALLRREAEVAAEVNHPHVIAALGADHAGPRPHLVLPYLEGINLRRLLAARSERTVCLHPAAFALSIARQLAAALAALHAAGWLHGQLRPEHAIVSPQGHVTLLDLTQTRRLASVECSSGLAPPTAPAYAAPEAFSSREMLTPASDVYSLGILLFELLAGQLPFVAASPTKWAAGHCRQAPPDLRDLQPSISHDIAQLVRRMLAKEPLRRPAADELVDRLAGLEIDELL